MLDVVLPGSVTETWPCWLMVSPLGDRRLYQIAFGGHDAALIVHLKRAVAGVAEGAVRHQDLEPAGALDCDVERVAGLRERALRHQPWRADGFHARADFDADWQNVAVIGGLRADALDVLVNEVLKLGALAFEAGGPHVGDVAGDHLDLQVLGCHSGRCGIKRAHDL
jgi:hypothetical protein